MGHIHVRPAHQVDVHQIKALSNTVFGQGYLDHWSLPNIHQENAEHSIYLVATEGTHVIGMLELLAVVDEHWDKLTVSDFYTSSLARLISHHGVGEEKTNAFLNLIMVDEQYRRQGVGTSLYKAMLQALSTTNCKRLYGTCWREGNSGAIIRFLEKYGWKAFSSKEKYWYEDSLSKGYKCKQCGTPCICTAVVMVAENQLLTAHNALI